MTDPKNALEAELLRRYDQLHPKEERHVPWKTIAVAAGVLLAAGAAPAQYAAEVGKKVDISVAQPAKDMPGPEEIVPVLRDAGKRLEVEVRVQKGPEALSYSYSLWGDAIATDIEARLRSAFPALKDAAIAVSTIEGKVKTSVAGMLEKKLLQAGDDPVKLEAARREIQAELQKQHPGAQIEVDAAPGGPHRVRVIEHKERK